MTFTLSVLASLVAGLLLPRIVRVLNNIWNHFFTGVAKVEGNWVATFTEPDGTENNIEVRLKRLGTAVRGTGYVTGRSDDPFCFRGTLKRQSLAGDFWRSRSRVLAGTGAFLLKVAADEKTMLGFCSWYDTETDAVWNSNYRWNKRPNN